MSKSASLARKLSDSGELYKLVWLFLITQSMPNMCYNSYCNLVEKPFLATATHGWNQILFWFLSQNHETLNSLPVPSAVFKIGGFVILIHRIRKVTDTSNVQLLWWNSKTVVWHPWLGDLWYLTRHILTVRTVLDWNFGSQINIKVLWMFSVTYFEIDLN